jgi:hypothetical protein
VGLEAKPVSEMQTRLVCAEPVTASRHVRSPPETRIEDSDVRVTPLPIDSQRLACSLAPAHVILRASNSRKQELVNKRLRRVSTAGRH